MNFENDRVDALSVADFLARYYRLDRYHGRGEEYAAAVLASHEKHFEERGFDIISRHESVTGRVVAYFGPPPPDCDCGLCVICKVRATLAAARRALKEVQTMTENKHAPFPWFDWAEYREQHGRSIVAYRDASGAIVSVLNCEEQEANAQFIIRAANAHDALVGACEAASHARHDNTCKRWDNTGRRWATDEGCDCHVGQARAALALVRGEEEK